MSILYKSIYILSFQHFTKAENHEAYLKKKVLHFIWKWESLNKEVMETN